MSFLDRVSTNHQPEGKEVVAPMKWCILPTTKSSGGGRLCPCILERMLSLGTNLGVSCYQKKPFRVCLRKFTLRRQLELRRSSPTQWLLCCPASSSSSSSMASDHDPDFSASSPLAPLSTSSPTSAETPDKSNPAFCIIEGPETVQDFAKMELQEIQDNIRSRRNKIFLHMEEVRRLRIQQRIKNAELGISNDKEENELPDFPSFIPFLPPLSAANLKQYYATCFTLIGAIILFGGLLAPSLELKLGIGGTSYADFIQSMHLPMQLSEVDPIVASFSGGAVGVISALMVVEINNVKQQEDKRCKYCLGTGYLACARCSSTGSLVLAELVSTVNGEDQPLSRPNTERCPNCAGSGKVMCPTCLCTGMAMASEHDPRIDPFD